MSIILKNVYDRYNEEYVFYFQGILNKGVTDISRYIPIIRPTQIGKGVQDYKYYTDFENILKLKLEFNLVFLEKRMAQEYLRAKNNKTLEEKLVLQVKQFNNWVSDILTNIMRLYYNDAPRFHNMGYVQGNENPGLKSGRTLEECFKLSFESAKKNGDIYDIIMKQINPLGLVVKIVNDHVKEDAIKDKLLYNKNL